MANRLDYFSPKGTGPTQGLYSHVARVETTALYLVAGQLSVNRDGEIVGRGDFDAQFRQVFANISDLLAGIGCNYNDVGKFTTYLVRGQDVERFMELRRDLFPSLFVSDLYPPNTLVLVDRLVKEDFLIEIEMVVCARS